MTNAALKIAVSLYIISPFFYLVNTYFKKILNFFKNFYNNYYWGVEYWLRFL